MTSPQATNHHKRRQVAGISVTLQWRIHGGGLKNLLPDKILGLQTTRKPTAAGTLPRTPLGELTALPRPRRWWGGGWLPNPNNSTPASALLVSPSPSPLAKAFGSAPATLWETFFHNETEKWQSQR